MRLWSVHPKYLDQRGLVAVWREGLLAKKVLEGKTKGYKNHPQLQRFKLTKNPILFINAYLLGIYQESCRRNYCFDKSKIGETISKKIILNNGQLAYEWQHLLKKVEKRDKLWFDRFKNVKKILPHRMFSLKNGGVEKWEKI